MRSPLASAAFTVAAAVATASVFVFGLTACGHPASRAECDVILDKIVELELRGQNITDPTVVAQRKEETRKAKGEELGKRCEGRKVTDATMACVRGATSYEQIENQCLR